MSLTVKSGATTSVTGGSDVTFIAQQVTPDTVVMVESGAELNARMRLTSKVSQAIPNSKAPGKMQNARHVITMGKPMVTAVGDVAFNSIQISFSRHPELTITDADDFVDTLISGCVDGGAVRSLLKNLVQPA